MNVGLSRWDGEEECLDRVNEDEAGVQSPRTTVSWQG